MVDSEETVALRVRRNIIKQVNETTFNEFLIETHPDVASFIIKKSDTDFPILPFLNGKKFYLKPVKTMHMEEIKVTGIADGKKREEALKEAHLFS